MDGVRKARGHLELNLERDVRGNKKSFLNYLSNRRKMKENVPTAVCGKRFGDMEEAEALDAFLASDFNGKICLQESQTRKRPAQDWIKEDLHYIEKDEVMEHLNKLDIHEFMLRELVKTAARPLDNP